MIGQKELRLISLILLFKQMTEMSMDANATMSANATAPAEPTITISPSPVTDATPTQDPAPASGPPATFKDAIKAVPILGWVAFGGSFF